MIKRLLYPWRLQWKLTCSYIFVSVLSWFLVAFLLLGLIWRGMEVSKASILFWLLQNNMQKVVSLVDREDRIDQAAFAQWLRLYTEQSSLLVSYEGSASIVDKQGKILFSVGSTPRPVGTTVFASLSRQNAEVLRALLSDQNRTGGRLNQEREEVVAMVPIVGRQHQALAAVVVQAQHLQAIPWLGFGIGLFILTPPFLIFALFAGIVGAISGYLTSRRLVQRFERLASTAEHWSRGNFSRRVHDSSADELGQLAEHMNQMAGELQNLLQTRQELATLQERGRIARDLHDSIKQQMFALYMQIKGVKSLLRKQCDSVFPHLEQAEVLILQVQKDLNSLIYELRPPELEDKTFFQALQEQVERWACQTGIRAAFQYEVMIRLAPSQEDALYRFVQEALSNIARHSQARAVTVLICEQHSKIYVMINDDGKGFEVATSHGKGLGLRSMQERLMPFDGTLEIRSQLGKGTEVIATLPYSRAS
ncbi:sensor histidine kinase [Ktedonosporobacter rubrisoli]|uniref:Oxygen sensor histidine kinase NreB n=1 Tax=Ktedonosporobacter rubrisoli TaxID=2509675 RepID=A0A4P6JQI8_KTERU|nr:sensor histidine kinase [Ktedonosporobacter rubrisoli]QBD77595.1 sensor histidine kinase [Ktedonosporobacter rubrisoli]